MEPADLNSRPAETDPLESLLRQRAPALPDDGFSVRVLAALPTHTPQRTQRVSASPFTRSMFCLVGGLLGAAVAIVALALSPGVTTEASRSLDAIRESTAVLFNPSVALALAVATASVLFAFRGERRRSV